MRLDKKNRLKNKLKNNELTIGSWLTIPSQQIVEVMSTTELDWIVIDLEHAPINIESVVNLVGHIQGNNMSALVRVGSHDELIIKRVLDAGADGIIVPMVKNKNQTHDIVNKVKYPPDGLRGVGLNRAHSYGYGFKDYLEIQKKLIIIVQIEHIESVNNLEDIISVEGIDGILVGPYDLSASMGYPGDYNRKDVLDTIKEIEDITKKSNKSLGFHVIETNHEEVLKKINSNYNFIAFSMDFLFFGNYMRQEFNNLKNKLNE